MHPDTLADFSGNVRSTYGAEEQKTVIVDVMDDEANLIHVPGIHEAHRRLRIDDRRDIAHDVRRQPVGIRTNILAKKLRYGLLKAARPRGRHNFLQELE